MKRIVFAVAALLAAASASAQQPTDVPKPPCAKPEYPGHLALTEERHRRAFDRDMQKYKDCIGKYVDDRKAAVKANNDAANAAIDEYNAIIKKVQEEEKARQ